MSSFTPWAGGTLVNAVVTGPQSGPDIVALAGGRYAIAYRDASGEGSDPDIGLRVQIFDPDGSRVSAAIEVNTATTGTQEALRLAATDDGGFVAVWTDGSVGANTAGDDASGTAIRFQRFTADGLADGGEMLVNGITASGQSQPDVLILPNGQIVVSYMDGSQSGGDTLGTAMRVVVLNPDGTRAGSDVLINTTVAGNQGPGRLAALGADRLVALFADDSATGSDTSGSGLRGQILSSSGFPLGAEFAVNSVTTGDQTDVSVTGLVGGQFVAVWTDASGGVETAGDDASGTSIRLRVFDETGTAISPERLANSTTAGDQGGAEVLAMEDGRFLVAWEDASGDASGTAIRAQVFRANGTKWGDEFIANDVTTGDQGAVSLAQLTDGRVVIGWSDESNGAETNGDDPDAAVRSQIFDLRAAPVVIWATELSEVLVGTNWNDVIIARQGDDRLFGGDGYDALFGGKGDDFLSGGYGHDSLTGGVGNDTLLGGRGIDSLDGGPGDDVIDGGGARDKIYAGWGDDTITGGARGDTIWAGAGADIFIYRDETDSVAYEDGGLDWIGDFDPGEDHFDFSAIDADKTTPGIDDAFVFIGDAAFSGAAGELRYLHNRSGTVIEADTDGDAIADMSIILGGELVPFGGRYTVDVGAHMTLTASDFVL